MENTPYRHYLAWMVWRSNQLNKPTLTDYYLMQVAQEVRMVLAKNPSSIKLDDFLLKFKRENEESVLTEEELKEKEAQQRAIIFAAVGYKPGAKGVVKRKPQHRPPGPKTKNPTVQQIAASKRRAK